MAVFSKRSKDNLVGVAPALVRVMEEAIKDTPVDFTVVEGVRTAATQQKYYSWGRTVVNPNTGPLKGKPLGMVVTNANGTTKKSNHQPKADGYGHAVDVYPFFDGKVQTEGEEVDRRLAILAAHVKATAKCMGIAITWGGDWRSPYDPPHFELKA